MQPVTNPPMITCLTVCGIDSRLTTSASPQQKWISSLEFVKQFKQPPSTEREKFVELVPGLFLKILYNQPGKLPVNQLQVMNLEINDSSVFNRDQWHLVGIHGQQKPFKDAYRQKNVNIKNLTDQKRTDNQSALVLCYHCQQSTQNALTDIGILKAQKGRQQKDVFNVPQGYKILNHTFSYKGRIKYLIYKRVPNKLELSYNPIFLQSYPIKPQKCQISFDLLPQFCFPDGVHLSQQMRGFITFSFVLSSTTRTYCSCMVIKQLLPNHLKKKLGLKQQKIYFEKALCIVSDYSYPQQFCQILQHLYRISMSKNDIPFYIVVESMVQNLTMISQQQMGKVSITYPYGGCNVIFNTNINFPVASDKSIYSLIKFLSTPNIILLFQAILLQKQIFLVSQSKTVIGLIFEAIEAIIFPFKWQHVLIPILPQSLAEYTEAIVPFIIGIPPALANLDKQQCIFVDLDHNQFLNGQQMPPLPDKIQKQLYKRLFQYQYYVQTDVQQYLQNPQNTYIFQMASIDYPDFDAYDVRDAFFEFILNLMKNYNKYWNKTKKQALYKDQHQPLKQMNELFNVQDFLDDLGMSKIGSFGYKFSQTTVFTHFIEKRCRFPNDTYFLFFDDCIEKKKKKKQNRCIVYSKPEKFKVVSSPNWVKDKTYSYENLPSILKQTDVDINEIDLLVQDQQTQILQQNEKKNMFTLLLQKHSMFKGIFQPIGQQIPISLQKLNVQTEIQTLANELLDNQSLKYLIKQISQMSDIRPSKQSRSPEIGKSKRDLKAFEIIDERLTIQIMKIQQFEKHLQKLERDINNVLFINLVQKRPVSALKTPQLTVEILLQDIKIMKSNDWKITFDNRRASSSKFATNIVIHNTSTKQILNAYILKQPKKFFKYVQMIHQQQMVWTFQHFSALSQ